ncbi:hypothetical protein ACHAW5_008049 [Stephanodiscus triporus]|uniref:Uncharacterized protein n=1 Tax=Stephanodiscus triporus TaxID=2934178 RepID=A0ABD3Q150_9STRA
MIICQQPIPQNTNGGSIAAVARTSQYHLCSQRDRGRCAHGVSLVDADASPKSVMGSNDSHGYNRTDDYANAVVGGGCTDMSSSQRDVDTHHTIASDLPLAVKDAEANCYRSEEAQYNQEQDQEEVSIHQYITRAAFDNAEQVHKSGTIDEDEAFFSPLQRSPFSKKSASAEAPSYASGDISSFDGCIMTDDELCGLFGTARCNADVPFPRTAYLLHQKCTSEMRPYLKILMKECVAERDNIFDDANPTKCVNKNCSSSSHAASRKEQLVAFRSFESLLLGNKHDSASRVL